jgi:hypothetical protein
MDREVSEFVECAQTRVGGAKPSTVLEITKYMRGHGFNHEGHVGVHYTRDNDAFRVLVYTGLGNAWLPGDGEPGRDGPDIWFSDLVPALNARDKYGERARCRGWLRDRERAA